jgi:hypothetical protein
MDQFRDPVEFIPRTDPIINTANMRSVNFTEPMAEHLVVALVCNLFVCLRYPHSTTDWADSHDDGRSREQHRWQLRAISFHRS